MADITFSTGVVEMSVNGSERKIRLNPADIGFMETLYSLLAKVESIDKDGQAKRSKTQDPTKIFDSYRNDDKRMKDAVDAVFGEGFCGEVFDGVRLMALADGLTVLENFIYAVMDHMDDTVKENLAKREGRIAKYTERYERRGA